MPQKQKGLEKVTIFRKMQYFVGLCLWFMGSINSRLFLLCVFPLSLFQRVLRCAAYILATRYQHGSAKFACSILCSIQKQTQQLLPHTAVIDPSSRTPSKNFCSLMDNVEIAPPYCGVYIRLYWIFSPIFEAKYLFVLIYYWSENFLLDMCAVFIEIDVFFGWLQYFFFYILPCCVLVTVCTVLYAVMYTFPPCTVLCPVISVPRFAECGIVRW